MIVQDKRDIVRRKKDESVSVSKMELKQVKNSICLKNYYECA